MKVWDKNLLVSSLVDVNCDTVQHIIYAVLRESAKYILTESPRLGPSLLNVGFNNQWVYWRKVSCVWCKSNYDCCVV